MLSAGHLSYDYSLVYSKPVNPKGNQPWIITGRTGAEAPILWPPDAKSWLTGKDPDAGKDWRQEKGATEDEMAGWHHGLNGHEFERTPGCGEGQGNLACCCPWGRKESDTTERLINNKFPMPAFILSWRVKFLVFFFFSSLFNLKNSL